MAKTSFNEFLLAVAPEHRVFVEKLNDKLLKQGCELVIKEVKSGYTATYQLEKKTVMNWVFRKTGIWARIYGDNAGRYEEVIAALPAHMQKKMAASFSASEALSAYTSSLCTIKAKGGRSFPRNP